MSDEKSTKKEREEVFTCAYCDNNTAHQLLTLYTEDVPIGLYDDNFKEILEYYYYYVFRCKTCNGLSIKGLYSEDIDSLEGPYQLFFDNLDYIYPSPKDLGEDIPKGLNLVLNEANKVKKSSSIAYIILIRKVLEELCKDRGVKSGKLVNQLKELVNKEQLPKVFSEAANILRLLGNIGAHETSIKIDKSDIEIIEKFIISLIEFIYVIPAKLKKLDDALSKHMKSP